ncbi:MAG: hypothetical protein F4Y47_05140 [Acidobacteriia bacterium]|nr:hypothetical protein [Terriglobia bacterium]MYK08365.1 hypothetical protein [Terriglobia bacterium]
MRFVLVSFVALMLLSCTGAADTPADQLAREQAFEESMRGTVLDGHFTLVRLEGDPSGAEGGGDAARLRSERYEIEKVVKRSANVWTFHARIQFGNTDVTLPVPVKLTWADDTPVVSVTDLGLPGLGSYTARVLFYGDSYAGTWSGGTHGGSMFGRLERAE